MCRPGEDAGVRPHGALCRWSLGSRGTPAYLPTIPVPPRDAVRRSVWERLRAARAREVWPGSRRGRERRGSDPASPAPLSPLPLLRPPHPGGARSGAGPRDAAVSFGCRCEPSLVERLAGRGPWRRRRGEAREGRARGRPRCPGRAGRARARGVAGGRCGAGGGRRPLPRPPFSSARAAARPPLLTGCRHVFPTSVPSSPPSPPSRAGGAPLLLSRLRLRAGRTRGTHAHTHTRSRAPLPLEPRPQIRRGDPLNLSILVSGGKETNQDSLSNGE